MTVPKDDSRVQQALRVGAGLLFVGAGALKFLLPSPGPGLAGGAQAFGHSLALLGVPLPALAGYAIPTLEISGGIALLTRRYVRLWAAALACNMMGAIMLVGLPGLLGRPLKVGAVSIGAEPWRLPLEFTLLLTMIWLVFKKAEGRRQEAVSSRQ